ncbi:aldose epimerase family protein [Oricola sp.]|uniref:aldose epimerase family protein n=1 Tax=Oricola sp. TaxID=1979950 RepID=UPI0025D2FCB0|nr:aldose epimerase family protein [Oricola sp.]MCI5076285.1 galactose mutarotase [Oricola sp.]
MESFGRLASGETVHRIVLQGGGLSAHVITRGAAIQNLRLDGHAAPLVLGLERLEDYERHSPFFGAIAGRFANRIGGARFMLDGREHRLDANDHDHCLHGGAKGFSEKLWTVEQQGDSHVVLRLDSPDGDMGFPGRVTARCRYELAEGGALAVTLSAETDAPTVCSMAHHSYFNLEDGGETPATGHEMQISAETYLPVDATLIPDGAPQPVDGTRFDFRDMKRIDAYGPDAAYDHNFCLDRSGQMQEVVQLRSPRSGVSLTVETTEPGLQCYTAPSMQMSVSGLGGRIYGHHAGICLETQIWPDAPNRADFPSAVLRPGQIREQRTIYRFKKG